MVVAVVDSGDFWECAAIEIVREICAFCFSLGQENGRIEGDEVLVDPEDLVELGIADDDFYQFLIGLAGESVSLLSGKMRALCGLTRGLVLLV